MRVSILRFQQTSCRGRNEKPQLSPGLVMGIASATTSTSQIFGINLLTRPFETLAGHALAVRAACRSVGMLIIAGVLGGCASSAPVVVTEVVHQPTFIPVPSMLTAPVSAVLPQGVTWGQALGLQQAAIQTCNADLNAISTLKPPPNP